MTIYDEYKEIYQTIQQLGYFLIKKLNKCEVEKTDNLSFDQLITAIEEIKTKPYINNNNIKPTNKPELVTDKSLADFNKNLAERIVYYKKLIAYYLVLKGIPTYEVNACNTLAELINLIDKIEIVKKSYLTIDVNEINESFGYAIPVPYTLQDRDGNDITEGSLTLEYEGATYFFTAGDEITFTPLNITESSTLKLEYHGSDNYYQHDPVYIDVKITPSKIKLNIDIENINYSSRYVNSHDTGYTDDTWQFTIETFNYKGIPLGNIDIELTSENLNKTFKTDNNGKYTFTSKIEDSGQQILKFITQANSTEYTNTEVEYNIFIKYNMLSTSANITNYAGKTYTYNLEIHDEDTNQIDTSYDGQSINIVYENGDVTTETIQNGKISHSRTSLIAGEYSIGWIFYVEDFETSTKTNLHILSNFILPEEDTFFLNTTPIIKYQPLGNTTINKEVEISINGLVTVSVEAYDEDNNQIFEEDDDGNLIPVYTDEIQEQVIISEGTIFKTDSNGILTDFATILDAGQYKVTLKSHSDDLNETITYDYELKKPFTVELSDYDKKDHAEFKLIIYDFNDLINYSAINGTNNIWDIRVEEEDTPANIDEYISKTIRWYAMPSTIGTNTFTIEQNGYTETLEFKLYDRLFNFSEDGTLSTQITRTVGIANIQVACIDESVNSISITGTEVLSIEKINDLFNVEILNRNTGLKTLLITDDSGVQEALTVNIIKDNLTDYINANITLYDENVDNDTFAIINYFTEENEDITNMYNISFDIELPNDINGEIINFFFNTDSQNTPIAQQGSIMDGICQIGYQQIPEGEYECRIEYAGNSTYSAYTKTFQVTIPKPKESEILEVEVPELNNLLLSFIIDKEIYSDLNTIYYKITNNDNTIDYCTFKYSTENEILTSLGEQSLSIPTTLLPDEACKFTFIFYGNDNYESFTKEITLKIVKAQPTLEIDTYVGYDPTNYGSLTFVEIPSTAQINEEFTIAVQLLNHIKQPMPGETVKFWINEELYETKQTNTSGICYVSYSLKDTSDLYIRCSSTNVVSKSSIIKNVENLQLSTSLTDYSIDDEILFEAKCLNNDGELVNGVRVDFYVDDVYYDSAVSENGVANVSFIAEDTEILYIKAKIDNLYDISKAGKHVIFAPLLDGIHETIKTINGSTTIINGIMYGGTSLLTHQWNNTIDWELEFDALIYEGTAICIANLDTFRRDYNWLQFLHHEMSIMNGLSDSRISVSNVNGQWCHYKITKINNIFNYYRDGTLLRENFTWNYHPELISIGVDWWFLSNQSYLKNVVVRKISNYQYKNNLTSSVNDFSFINYAPSDVIYSDNGMTVISSGIAADHIYKLDINLPDNYICSMTVSSWNDAGLMCEGIYIEFNGSSIGDIDDGGQNATHVNRHDDGDELKFIVKNGFVSIYCNDELQDTRVANPNYHYFGFKLYGNRQTTIKNLIIKAL